MSENYKNENLEVTTGGVQTPPVVDCGYADVVNVSAVIPTLNEKALARKDIENTNLVNKSLFQAHMSMTEAMIYSLKEDIDMDTMNQLRDISADISRVMRANQVQRNESAVILRS